jgi:hypothetical protein
MSSRRRGRDKGQQLPGVGKRRSHRVEPVSKPKNVGAACSIWRSGGSMMAVSEGRRLLTCGTATDRHSHVGAGRQVPE